MGDGPDNCLFVVLDSVRKDHLTPYGYERDTTPGLGAFAAEAAVFEEAVAPAPWTLPVHASLFTGRYPSEHGADQETPYLEGETTLAETLSAAGYDTACYSSNAWITPYTRLTAGFDDCDNFFRAMPGDLLPGALADAWQYVNDAERLRPIAERLVGLGNVAHEYFAAGDAAASKTPAALDRTREFIRDADAGWFAFVNLMDAHLPYHPPAEYADAFAPGVDPADVCQNSKEFNCGGREIGDDEWEAIRGLYDAEIAHLDAELRRLFDWLRDADRWADTMIVVCADHGELHGERGLFGHEFGLYDPLVNVPLLIKHPDLDADRRTDQVELLDLYHTVLDALNVDPAAVDANERGASVGGGGASVDDVGASVDDDGASTNGGGEGANDDARENGGPVGLDPTRSLLRDEYRAFEAADDPDPGQRAIRRRRTAGDGADYAFVEYAQPAIELRQLEVKARKAGVDLDEGSRHYARMRAARCPDATYVRRDRVPDETITRGDGRAVDEIPARVERALSAFERAVGGAWTGAADAPGAGTGGVDEIDGETAERLRELGYLE